MVKFTSLMPEFSQATEPWVFVKALVPKVKPPHSDINRCVQMTAFYAAYSATYSAGQPR